MIYSSQKFKAMQIFIIRKLDKQIVVYLCNTFLSNKRTQTWCIQQQRRLKNFMLHERSQAQESTFTRNSQTSKVIIKNRSIGRQDYLRYGNSLDSLTRRVLIMEVTNFLINKFGILNCLGLDITTGTKKHWIENQDIWNSDFNFGLT